MTFDSFVWFFPVLAVLFVWFIVYSIIFFFGFFISTENIIAIIFVFGIYLLGLQCFRVNEWLHQCQHLNDRRHLQMAMNKYLLKKFVYTLSCAMAFLHTLKWGACSCLCLSVRLFAAKQRIVCFFFFLQLLLNGFYALWTIFIFHILSSNNHFFFSIHFEIVF